jgi:integrase
MLKNEGTVALSIRGLWVRAPRGLRVNALVIGTMNRCLLRTRQRGTIDKLPSGALRVRVYSGVDPISKRRMYLTEVVPAGPKVSDQAEKVRTRLLHQVDEKRNPRTRATVGQLLDRWLQVLDVDPSTRRTYDGYIRKHIRPVLGSLPLTRLDVEILDSFCAELRRCREHCEDRPHPAT